MYVYITYTYIYIPTHIYIYTFVGTFRSVHMYIYTYRHIYVHVQSKRTITHMCNEAIARTIAWTAQNLILIISAPVSLLDAEEMPNDDSSRGAEPEETEAEESARNRYRLGRKIVDRDRT